MELSYEVTHSGNTVADKKPFTIVADTTYPPFSHKLVYHKADFPEVSTATYGFFEYEVLITVFDDASTEAHNTYTINVNIDNTNHKPYFNGSPADTVLDSWTVGS